MFSTGPDHPAATPNRQPRQTARHGQDIGGDDRDRTGDPLLAKQVLSQLSYSPVLVGTREEHGDGANVVGLGRVELPTSALSGLRSNQLSYRPM